MPLSNKHVTRFVLSFVPCVNSYRVEFLLELSSKYGPFGTYDRLFPMCMDDRRAFLARFGQS